MLSCCWRCTSLILHEKVSLLIRLSVKTEKWLNIRWFYQVYFSLSSEALQTEGEELRRLLKCRCSEIKMMFRYVFPCNCMASSSISVYFFQDEPASQSHRRQVSGHHGLPAHVKQRQSDLMKIFIFSSWKGNRLRTQWLCSWLNEMHLDCKISTRALHSRPDNQLHPSFAFSLL